MAVILEFIKSDVDVSKVFDWLTTSFIHEDIEFIFKNHSERHKLNYTFPILLVTFIKDQSSSILKWHNIGPIETANSAVPTSRKEILTVPDLLSVPSIKFVKNSGTPQETRNIRRVNTQKIDLKDEASFPSLQSTVVKEIPKKRRINPTQISEVNEGGKSSIPFSSCARPAQPTSNRNPFNLAKEQSGEKQKNLDQERALLKERKQQLVTYTVPDIGSNLPKSWTGIEPDLNSVTHIKELTRLSTLFAFCLSNNLIPFLYNEIKFLLELLVLRLCPARFYAPSDETSLFNSVHNCVYFAATTLEKLDGLWGNVDRCLLQLLLSNSRLAIFSTGCVEKLSRMASEVAEIKRPPHRRTVANVAFQSDTDNRQNFSSDISFQTFRKQRDQFCEAWQIWKANNATPGWNMAMALQKMIRSLVDMRRDCVNYVHLARLFRSQLLDVAQLVDTELEEEHAGPLGQLQSSDPDKLRRLRERLINPPQRRSRSDIEKLTFDGDQEFFRDFILMADSSPFNEHLKNSLLTGIEEYSREEFDGQVKFAETVVALQVMAKFLAFLNFQPYISGERMPEHIFHHLSYLRSNQQSVINLFRYLDDSFTENRLVLTVPWIVLYLSLADSVFLSLPICHPVLCYLVYIYRKATLCSANGFFIRIILSWLFDQPHFPRPLLVKPDDELRIEIQRQRPAEQTLSRLDHNPLVDSTLMYQCCPWLWTWKNLLIDFACSDAKSSGERSLAGRKITPISAGGESPSKLKTPVKSLQMLLEENFFHNQPSSVKRTVDFVAERLASNIVRDVRHKVIPRLALEAQSGLKAWPANENQQRIDSVSQQLVDDVRREAIIKITSTVAVLDNSLTALLPNDMLPAVRKVCFSIAAKEMREKVLDWINLHVTVGLFQSDLIVECEKRAKLTQQITVHQALEVPILHDSSTWAPSFLIDHLKKLIRLVIRDVSRLTNQDVIDILSRTEGTLQRRKDVTPVAFKCLQQLTFDFLFIICVFQPHCVGSQNITAWVAFWRRMYCNTHSATPLEESETTSNSSFPWLVFSPKQLLLLAQSISPRNSWDHVTFLVLQLLKNDLVQYAHIEEQAVAVVRQEWPQELLGRFATCVRDIVDWQRSQRRNGDLSTREDHPEEKEDNNEDGLLSWLSWFCAQDDLL